MEGNEATIAALVAAAMSLVKAIERGIDWMIKHYGKEKEAKELIVRLDPEASQAIKEMHAGIMRITTVVERYDDDGIPLVYTPRSFDDTQKEILSLMRDVSHSQERLAAGVEKLSETVDESIDSKKRR